MHRPDRIRAIIIVFASLAFYLAWANLLTLLGLPLPLGSIGNEATLLASVFVLLLLIFLNVNRRQRQRRNPTAAILAMLFTFVFLPAIVSLPFVRYGWVDGIPGLWNATGLVLALPGLILLSWAVGTHRTNAPEAQNMDTTPSHLLTQGPYRYTRNPVYLSYLLFWLAWAVFYGSISVLAVLAVLSAIAQFMLVPSEERTLDKKFGDEYRRYKKQAPRWFRLWK